MENREFSIETPIGSVKSDSGSHVLDVVSVVGVIAILWLGKIILKKVVDKIWMARVTTIGLNGLKILKKVIGEYLMAKKPSKPKRKKTTTSKQQRKYGGY